jgi:hypothetical protein
MYFLGISEGINENKQRLFMRMKRLVESLTDEHVPEKMRSFFGVGR